MTFRFLLTLGGVRTFQKEESAMENPGRFVIETISDPKHRLARMELRKQVRHRLSADAVFTWDGAEQTCLHGAGITRDVSLSGVYIFSLTCPPMGATIQLDVLLLPLDSGMRSLRLKTNATVIRVEHANPSGEEGFAVAMDGLSLIEGGNDLRVDQR